MKRTLIASLLFSVISMQAFAATPAQHPAAAPSALKTDNDKLSYSMGVVMGAQMKRLGITLSPQAYSQGLNDALSGKKIQMTDAEIQTTLMTLKTHLMAKQASLMMEMKSKNEKESTAFLAKNKSQTGVVVLPDGLQYKVLTQGNGASPSDSDSVVVHYSGSTIDGKEFDSSYKRGQPITIGVTNVIPGWTEALKLMKEGSTWQVYIPATLAYGDKGAPPVIGPGQALIFKINLISVKKGNATAPTTAPVTAQ